MVIRTASPCARYSYFNFLINFRRLSSKTKEEKYNHSIVNKNSHIQNFTLGTKPNWSYPYNSTTNNQSNGIPRSISQESLPSKIPGIHGVIPRWLFAFPRTCTYLLAMYFRLKCDKLQPVLLWWFTFSFETCFWVQLNYFEWFLLWYRITYKILWIDKMPYLYVRNVYKMWLV